MSILQDHLMDYLVRRAIEYRIARVNRVRCELYATPPKFLSRRLRLEVELDLERGELAELLRTRSLLPFARGGAAA